MGAGASTAKLNVVLSRKSMPRVTWEDLGRDEEAQRTTWAVQDNTTTRTARGALKERIQCYCEGGQGCTREDPAAQKGRNHIPNLHCNWVTDNILAMARPWQANLVDLQKGVMLEFRRRKIALVLNLQQLGEHAHCGPGVLPNTGFSYDPESFMAAGIHVFNGSWQDMGVPTMEHALGLVQLMCFFLEQGNRIAVHCHAGLGRTGLAIACCLVFQGTHSAADAVTLVRRMRPGSLQTRGQDHFVHAFERHVEHLRMQFRLAPVKRKVRLAAIFQTTSSSPRQATAVGKQDNRSRLRDTSSRILKLEATNGLPGSSRALEVSETDSPAIIPSRAAPPPRSNTPTASGRTEALSLRQGDSTLRWKLSPPSSFRSSQSRVDQGTQGQGSDSREASAPDADWELNDSDSGMAEMLDSFSMTSLAARKKKSLADPPVDINDVMKRQRSLLGGEERKLLYNVPKFVDQLRQELMSRASDAKKRSLLPLHVSLMRHLESRSNMQSTVGTEDSMLNSLEKAKDQINRGAWSVLRVLPVSILLLLLESWLAALAKPTPAEVTMFVNAVGVIRTRSTSAPTAEVTRKAAGHLSPVMRHLTQRLVSCCQLLSDGQDPQRLEPAVSWIVEAFCHDGSAGSPICTLKPSSSMDSSESTDESEENRAMIEEFFMFVGAENEGADALLPTKRLAGWRRRTRSALAFDPHPKVPAPSVSPTPGISGDAGNPHDRLKATGSSELPPSTSGTADVDPKAFSRFAADLLEASLLGGIQPSCSEISNEPGRLSPRALFEDPPSLIPLAPLGRPANKAGHLENAMPTAVSRRLSLEPLLQTPLKRSLAN